MSAVEGMTLKVLSYPDSMGDRLILADALDESDGEDDGLCQPCEGTGSPHVALGATATEFDPKCEACGGTGRGPNHYAARAEFIRCSIEAAAPPLSLAERMRRLGDGKTIGDVAKDHLLSIAGMVGRADELFTAHEIEWLRQSKWPGWEIGWQANSTWVPECTWQWANGFVSTVTTPINWLMVGVCEGCGGRGWTHEAHNHVGVPYKVGCTSCNGKPFASTYAARFVRSQPITHIDVEGRSAEHVRDVAGRGGHMWAWLREWHPCPESVHADPQVIPWPIFDRLRGPKEKLHRADAIATVAVYPLPDVADRDLDATCLRFAREAAELPEWNDPRAVLVASRA